MRKPFAEVCRAIFSKPVRPLTPAQRRMVEEAREDVAKNGWVDHQPKSEKA